MGYISSFWTPMSAQVLGHNFDEIRTGCSWIISDMNNIAIKRCYKFNKIWTLGLVCWFQTQNCRKMLRFYHGQPALQTRLFCSGVQTKTFYRKIVAKGVVLGWAQWNFDLGVAKTTGDLQKIAKSSVFLGAFLRKWG